MYFLGGKGLSNDDIEGAGGTVYLEIRPGAGFKTGDFVKEKLGEATVEPLGWSFKMSGFRRKESYNESVACMNCREATNSSHDG